MLHPSKRRSGRMPETRQEMIEQTNAFLSWALNGGETPKIPTRRVDRGGFEQLLRRPGGPAAATHWWRQALGKVLK